jgi:hypothetical protein
MIKNLTVTVKTDNLGEFFRSIITHSSREAVANIFSSGHLDWSSYWEINPQVRKHFVLALLWANIFPSPKELKQIILTEKLKSPLTPIFEGSSLQWWLDPLSLLPGVLRETFKLFSSLEYGKIFYKLDLRYLVWYSTSSQLPLLIGDKRWSKDNPISLINFFENRLKNGNKS